MELTSDQKIAFGEITKFLKTAVRENGDNMVHTLIGYAGSGKTTLTRFITDWCTKNGITFVGIAPTHKAKKVLEAVLNKDSFIENTTFTVAKFLNKLRNHGYVGSKNFSGSYTDRHYDVYLVDECSMISDRDVDDIMKVAKMSKSKILFIGDRAQIPNPSQRYSQNGDGTVSKKDSKAFDFQSSILTTIIRQSHENPLLDVYTEIRKDLMTIPDIRRNTKIVNGKGVQYYTKSDKFQKKICQVFKAHINDVEKYRIITYTNDMVRFYNNLVRKALEREDLFVVGEILMGYSNNELIENGQEYVVRKVEYKTMPVKYGTTYQAIGHMVTLSRDKDSSDSESFTTFFPDITKKENATMLNQLKELADKVNAKGSTRKDYGCYITLKNQLYFIENVYNYKGKIINESNMKESHPRLFDSLSSYITVRREINKSDKYDSLDKLYPNIIKDRLADSKPIGDTERVCDRFQIIEKDIDYGYAQTVHKSQGSTYRKVFVDEVDFQKIKDKWNSYAKAMENGTKERNQLMYVSYTRPTHIAYVLYQSDDSEDS